MVDVRWDHGTTARHFIAYELGRDEFRQRSAKAFAIGQGRLGPRQFFLATTVFAMSDEAHFLGDDARARKFKLGDHFAVAPAHRLRLVGELACEVSAAGVAVIFRLDGAAFVSFDAAAFLDPGFAVARQAFFDIDFEAGFRVRPGRVVELERRLAAALVQCNFAQGDPNVGMALRG